MMERLKAYYKDAHVDGNVFEAVLAVSPDSPFDFHQRVEALNDFIQKTESKSLIEANKRIVNILKEFDSNDVELDTRLLIEDSEKKLFQATESIARQLSEQKDYKAIVRSLLELKEVIDTFFDKVMVNVDDIELRQVRLGLLSRVRGLFLSVADVSYLT